MMDIKGPQDSGTDYQLILKQQYQILYQSLKLTFKIEITLLEINANNINKFPLVMM